MSLVKKSRVSSRVARMLIVTGLAVLGLQPTTAFSQTTAICGAEIKEAVAKKIASVESAPESQKLAMYDELYKQYQYCAQDSRYVATSFSEAARECGAAVSNLGSIFFEQMSCSGYDPQRRQFASPIKIKQVGGFGGTPLPGSREYVLHCVADPAGVLQPVGRDSVHLANALAGQSPTWQFAVITSANENLQLLQPMNNQTLNARSILSWAMPPTSCNFTPIWGNALNYRIRLDQ